MFSLNDQKKLVDDLKLKAPIIYERHKANKVSGINAELSLLRIDYKNTQDVKKRDEITQKAKALKEELNLYTTNV